ncbi:hypothetical protein CMI37_36725 [Candidatus Pacearchaeota archaeon]|nr:hypothetical protein [Candidatus Pacearchaeota archaeon]|tara:strand:+ start:1906 stop:2295 length:390 start_codon:yes stop_codon:yes gene_type:complete
MKTFKFFIPGPLPGLNEIMNVARGTKRGNLTAARQKAEWTYRVAGYIHLTMNQTKKVQFTGAVFIEFTWYEKNKRRDPDNIASAKKFLMDGMVRSGLICDDTWRYISGFSDKWVVNKTQPGVYVVVREV